MFQFPSFPPGIAQHKKRTPTLSYNKETPYFFNLEIHQEKEKLHPTHRNYKTYMHTPLENLDFLGWFNRDRVLAELTEYRINRLKGTVNFLSDFSASENDLSGHKYQQHNFRVDHPVNQTRKQFRFVLSLATCTGKKVSTDENIP